MKSCAWIVGWLSVSFVLGGVPYDRSETYDLDMIRGSETEIYNRYYLLDDPTDASPPGNRRLNNESVILIKALLKINEIDDRRSSIKHRFFLELLNNTRCVWWERWQVHLRATNQTTSKLPGSETCILKSFKNESSTPDAVAPCRRVIRVAGQSEHDPDCHMPSDSDPTFPPTTSSTTTSTTPRASYIYGRPGAPYFENPHGQVDVVTPSTSIPRANASPDGGSLSSTAPSPDTTTTSQARPTTQQTASPSITSGSSSASESFASRSTEPLRSRVSSSDSKDTSSMTSRSSSLGSTRNNEPREQSTSADYSENSGSSTSASDTGSARLPVGSSSASESFASRSTQPLSSTVSGSNSEDTFSMTSRSSSLSPTYSNGPGLQSSGSETSSEITGSHSGSDAIVPNNGNDGSPILNVPQESSSSSSSAWSSSSGSFVSFDESISSSGVSSHWTSPAASTPIRSSSSGFRTRTESGGSNAATAGHPSFEWSGVNPYYSSSQWTSEGSSLDAQIGAPRGGSTPNQSPSAIAHAAVLLPSEKSLSPTSARRSESASDSDQSVSFIVMEGEAHRLGAEKCHPEYKLPRVPSPNEALSKQIHAWQGSRLIGMPYSWYLEFEQIIAMVSRNAASELKAKMNSFIAQYPQKDNDFTNALLYGQVLREHGFAMGTIIKEIALSHFLRDTVLPAINDDNRFCLDIDFSEESKPNCGPPSVCPFLFQHRFLSKCGDWEDVQRALPDDKIRTPPNTLPSEVNTLDALAWPHPLRHENNNLRKRRYCSQPGSEDIFCEFNGFSLYNEPCLKISLFV